MEPDTRPIGMRCHTSIVPLVTRKAVRNAITPITNRVRSWIFQRSDRSAMAPPKSDSPMMENPGIALMMPTQSVESVNSSVSQAWLIFRI